MPRNVNEPPELIKERPINTQKDLAPGLIERFQNAAKSFEYQPFGAESAKLAKAAKARRKALAKLNHDELRLVLADDNYAKRVLTRRGKPASPNDILAFRRTIFKKNPNIVGEHYEGRPYPTFEQEKSNFGKPELYFGRGPRLKRVQEEADNRFTENEPKYEKEKRKEELLLKQSARLAPLQPAHHKAKTLLEDNRPNESLRLAAKEITAAGHTNIPREVEPYLRRASESPQAFVDRYKADYQPLFNTYRQEARKDFMEHILPSINNKFIGAGAFNSSARHATIAKAKADKEQRIENDIIRTLIHAQEKGMEHYHQHRQGTLQQGEIAGKSHLEQHNAKLKEAEALRINSAIGQSNKNQDISAFSQQGALEQRQLQNELNVAQQEHERAHEEPRRDVERQAALAHGIPMQQHQLSPERINPPPPNPLAFGAGILGQIAGLGMQPPQAAFKQGGVVRRGFAAGDSITRSMGQLQQLRNQGVQENPEEAEMRSSAQAFKNHRANPMADYLLATGSHMLANMGEDPMKAFGQGSQLGMQAYKAAQGENLSAKEKYNNLIGKINQSKMYQHELATKYHLGQQKNEEQQRYHNAALGESRRAHDMKYAAMQLKAEKPIKKTSTQQKLEDKALDHILENFDMKEDLDLIEDKISNATLGTGPWVGKPKSFLGIDNEIDVLGNHIVTKANKLYGRGAGSNMQLKTLQGGKPGQNLTKKANETIIKKYRKEALGKINKNIAYLLKNGWSPEEIKTATGIDLSGNSKKGEEGENVETPQESPENPPEGMTGGMVSMKVNGKTAMIPQDRVEEALQLGGQLTNG